MLAMQKVPMRSRKLNLSYTNACTWMFMTYMASGFLRTLFSMVLSKLRLGFLYVFAANIVIYAPFCLVVLNCLINRKIKFEVGQFLTVFAVVALLFVLTWIEHPSYEEYLTRPIFGAIDAVFRPDFGAIWGFLIVAVSKDSKQIFHNLYLGAWFLGAYCIYQYLNFLGTGYWLVYNYLGELAEQVYSLDFSYSCCTCSCIFLAMYSKEKHAKDMAMFLVTTFLMVIGGARGALACFAVFLVLYYFRAFMLLPLIKKVFVLTGIAASVVIIYMLMPAIIDILLQVDSRSIQSILLGTFAEDNGRSQIYAIVKDAMSEMPFWGYGPFGDRPFIAPKYYWGYSHSLVYEMIIDFGWIVGAAILIALAGRCIHVYLRAEGCDLIVISILIGANAKLFLSASFWAYAQFWMFLAYLFVIVPVSTRKGQKRTLRHKKANDSGRGIK